MGDPGFKERLSYARWLAMLQRQSYPANIEIARAVGVDPAWVTKWSRRDDAPDSRALGKRLAEFLGVGEEWLMTGEGTPPEPDLWQRWNRSSLGRLAAIVTEAEEEASSSSGAAPGADALPPPAVGARGIPEAEVDAQRRRTSKKRA